MKEMACVRWTAPFQFDYTSIGKTLIYEEGKTYYGMLYNWAVTGLENFNDALDENGTYKLDTTDPDIAPGNTCATSILHAWQTVCPSVQYQYTIDMMPCNKETGVVAIGDIKWDAYDGHDTDSVVNASGRKNVLESYTMARPADAMTRYRDTGGHALMVTKEPEVVYMENGDIDTERSFVFLTDQNNLINNTREYPSSWKIHRAVTFEKMYKDGYLPVAAYEIQNGICVEPVFELKKGEDGMAELSCNYCLMNVTLEYRGKDSEVFAATTAHPYTRSFEVCDQRGTGKIAADAGLYIIAECGMGKKEFML